MTARELEEYRALRDTIRERGTTRAWVLLAGFVAWAAVTTATAALAALPVATLLPLLILAVDFEIVFMLHTGVERIGRYIQVFFEDEQNDRGWEHRVMAYGVTFRAAGGNPLLAPYFWAAALLNFIPALLADPLPIEWSSLGAIHLLFALRVGIASRQAARQRQIDLERFRALKREEATKRENTKLNL